MAKEEKKREIKQPSLFVALIPIFFMCIFMGVGYVAMGLPSEPMMILTAVVAGIIAWWLGHSFNDMVHTIAEKIASVMPALLILITVGALIGSWMSGGTIPMLVYYGLKIVSPQYLYITALLVTAIVSVCTGTSWGSMGTIGVAFMGVALGMDGVNPAIVCGAVVSGAYFGDKLSPLSGDTNLAAAITRVDLFKHMAHLLWTTLSSLIVAAIVMFFAGQSVHVSSGSITKIEQINGTLSSIYDMNVIMLLIPVLIILVGSIMRKPTIPVMLLSSAVAMFNTVVIQHFSLANAFNAVVSGFDTTTFLGENFDLGPAAEDISSLLNRGGMSSMMSTLLIAFCALSFAGILACSGALDTIVNNLLKVAKSTGSLIVVTLITGILTIGTTCNGQVSLVLPGELLRPAYIKRGLHPCNLSRSIEDSGTIFEPIMPWTAAGAYCAATLGVATLSYAPWATLCWTGVIFATIWGFTGIGITKLTPEEQKEMLAELEKEEQQKAIAA
ncbi:sodium:proton antiporter [Bifidobacterium margollesii]|uniref:Sodium:proton antiporter n=1 Tax=Bifidobacterium margollesii TaxID=2020964 RepID=A0A2N5JAN6_9BIFI|nr:Na+/H+ antiporter NhaC [Bifidobacterium margollesii]PLS31269.1 sodium:proton antiporter [Bifidobacterium margollesii]